MSIDKRFKSNYSIAYVKSDAHYFDLDKEGKDTYKATQAGAKTIAIHSKNKCAILKENPKNDFWGKSDLLDADFVLIEGYKSIKKC